MVVLLALSCSAPPCPPECDDDGDGFSADIDCDDDDPHVFPGAEDLPGDGIDQDCRGTDGAASSKLSIVAEGVWNGPLAHARAGSGLVAADVDGDGIDEVVVTGLSRHCFPPFEQPTPDVDCTRPEWDGGVWILRWEAGALVEERVDLGGVRWTC